MNNLLISEEAGEVTKVFIVVVNRINPEQDFYNQCSWKSAFICLKNGERLICIRNCDEGSLYQKKFETGKPVALSKRRPETPNHLSPVVFIC